MENKKIIIVGNPSAGNIENLQALYPESSIVVVNDTQSKVDTSKYEERFRGYLFDRYEQFRNGKKTIPSILKASGVTSYDALVREYKLIKEKKGVLVYKARVVVCYVFEQVHKD